MKPAYRIFAFATFALLLGASFSARAEDQADYPSQHEIPSREIHATHSLRNWNCERPMTAREETPAAAITTVVLFPPASDKLTPAATVTVRKIASLLKSPAYRGKHILISGYTDGKGKVAANQRLSHHRALAVMHQLIKDGVPASMLTAQGFGKENPVATNATPAGRAMNRRVSFSVVESSTM